MLFSFDDIDRTFAHFNAAQRRAGVRPDPRSFQGARQNQGARPFQGPRGFDPALLASAFPGLFAQFEPRPRPAANERTTGAPEAAEQTATEQTAGQAKAEQQTVARPQRPARVLQPRFEVSEVEGGVVLLGDLPGVNEADLRIEFEQGLLSITGRRYLAPEAPTPAEGEGAAETPPRPYLEYQRRFRLAKDIDAERITARLELGVLTLTLPRIEAEKPKKIAVKVN